jgi:hypothetical protein
MAIAPLKVFVPLGLSSGADVREAMSPQYCLTVKASVRLKFNPPLW